MKSAEKFACDFFMMAMPVKLEGYEERVLELVRAIQADARESALRRAAGQVARHKPDGRPTQLETAKFILDLIPKDETP